MVARPALVAAGLLGLAGCRAFGINGPPAIACPERDDVCGGVRDALETVRENIGGWCGTPDMVASHDLFRIGPAAIPWLLGALDDRDEEVARFAASNIVGLGGGDALAAWCARQNETSCAAALQRHRELPTSIAGTYWMMPPRHSVEDGAVPTTRLALHERDGVVDGELCEADAACVSVHGLRAGTRLELEDPTRGAIVLFSAHPSQLDEYRSTATYNDERRFIAETLLATEHSIGGIAFDRPFDAAAYARTLPAGFRATAPTPSSTTIASGDTPLFTVTVRGTRIDFVRIESDRVRIYPGDLGMHSYAEQFAQQPCRDTRSERMTCTAAGWTFEIVGKEYANAKAVTWRR
jgi:hypothetical protein